MVAAAKKPVSLPILLLAIVILAVCLISVFYFWGGSGNKAINDIHVKVVDAVDLSPVGRGLQGEWVQDKRTDLQQRAVIADDAMVVLWIMQDGSELLYWSGTYEKPNNGTWVSYGAFSNNVLNLVAPDTTIMVFHYEDGVISYDIPVTDGSVHNTLVRKK